MPNNWTDPASGIAVSTTTYTFTGLTAETQYIVGVRAVCGENNYSDWATSTITTDEHACVIPTGLAYANPTFNGATFSWTAGEAIQTAWELNISGGTPAVDTTVEASATTVTVTGLKYGQTYSAKVRAICSATNASDWTAPVSFSTASCQTVSNVRTSNVTATTATVSWNASATAANGYQVEYGMRGYSQGYGTVINVTSGTSCNLTGLDPETNYDVYVRSVCAPGVTSLWSDVEQFATNAANPEVNYYTVTVNYNTTMGTVTGDGTYEENTTAQLVATPNSGYEFVNWTVGGEVMSTSTTYSFTVTGNVTVNANFQAAAQPGDCDAPTNLTVSNVTAHGATLTWQGEASSYQVYVNNDIVTTNATTHTLTNLNAETGYTVKVRAACAAGGYSEWSDEQTFTTLVGIDDVESSAIALYPNPASTTVTLTGIEGEAVVTVVDMNGRVAGEWTAKGGELTIDVTGLSQGAYFVRVTGDQGTAIRKLIVR